MRTGRTDDNRFDPSLGAVLDFGYIFILGERSAKKVNASQQQPKRPLAVLQKAISKKATIRLKTDVEYRGRVSNVDAFMNLILEDAEEFEGGQLSANYGRVIVRGDNVLYVRLESSL